MKRRSVLASALAVAGLLVLGGCSSIPAAARVAPERELTIQSDRKTTKDAVAALFLSRGYQLKADSDMQITFERRSENFMANLLLSSNYDSTVMTRVIITMIGDKPTNLSWRGYAVTNPGSAFERLTEITGSPDGDNVQVGLRGVKMQLEASSQ